MAGGPSRTVASSPITSETVKLRIFSAGSFPFEYAPGLMVSALSPEEVWQLCRLAIAAKSVPDEDRSLLCLLHEPGEKDCLGPMLIVTSAAG